MTRLNRLPTLDLQQRRRGAEMLSPEARNSAHGPAQGVTISSASGLNVAWPHVVKRWRRAPLALSLIWIGRNLTWTGEKRAALGLRIWNAGLGRLARARLKP